MANEGFTQDPTVAVKILKVQKVIHVLRLAVMYMFLNENTAEWIID